MNAHQRRVKARAFWRRQQKLGGECWVVKSVTGAPFDGIGYRASVGQVYIRFRSTSGAS